VAVPKDSFMNNIELDNLALETDARHEINTEVKRLAALPVSVYESQRVSAAKRLGWRTSILDDLVTSARPRSKEDDSEAALPHWQIEPWKDEVSTAELLDAIVRVFNQYIILPKHAAEAIALWILHAWVFDAWYISPFLLLTSPTKRCGKTTALVLLNWLTPRSVLAGNISASAIFRYIEEQRPTLLIDEADTFLKFSEEIRGILNAGHVKIAANTVRNVEIDGKHVPKRFSTWAPKVIAGIGRLAGTLEDRSIIVPMQRKSKAAKVVRCRYRDTAELAGLRQKCLRWATDNLPRLSVDEQALPDALNDCAITTGSRSRRLPIWRGTPGRGKLALLHLHFPVTMTTETTLASSCFVTLARRSPPWGTKVSSPRS
jgi:hypothetical protein